MTGDVLRICANATVEVIQKVSNLRPRIGRVTFSELVPKGDFVIVGLKFIGDSNGAMMLGFSRELSKEIAERMSFETYEDGFDPQIYSALLELLNMVAGNAIGPMEKVLRREVSISTPEIMDEVLSLDFPRVANVTLESDHGEGFMMMALL